MKGVHQLVYDSTFNRGRFDKALKCFLDIIEVSRRNNERADITGFLIFDGHGFLQVLEGAKADVDAIYDAILLDPRHHSIRLIGRLDVPGRAFGDWSMAGHLLRPIDQAIFTRHGVMGPINEAALSIEQAIALTIDLAARQRKPTAD